jgi:hypothetical protein
MKIDINDKYEFIPEWNENLQDESPIKVHCHYMTPPERDKCITKDLISDSGEMKFRFKQHDIVIIKTIIDRIENFEVNGNQVTNAAQLLKIPGVDRLVSEIASDAVMRNAEQDSKNS